MLVGRRSKAPGFSNLEEVCGDISYQVFPSISEAEMRKKFLELQQGDWTVNKHAAEFVRLNCFSPIMVANEEVQAHMFQ